MDRARVAVVGRPNVGKSTLVNRLAARRGSIVSEIPGLTRDRIDAEVTWRGRSFTLADTGGLVEESLAASARAGEGASTQGASSLARKVASQALMAVEGSDLVLLVVDAGSGPTSDDLALARQLRKVDVPVIVVVNKVDNPAGEVATSEHWQLGLGEPLAVSALHGLGTGDLLDRVVELLPTVSRAASAHEVASIALVGRPNVGKSSMFNRLVRSERAIVHPDPGTTRDAVDTLVEIEGRTYRMVDTAGLRRRAKASGVEIYSATRTRSAIERADVAVLIVDAAEGAGSQDQRIAQELQAAGVGVVLLLNKWDLVDDPQKAAELEHSVTERLHFLSYAPVLRASALTGRGVGRLIPHIDRVLEARRVRIPTPRFNEILQQVQGQQPPPRTGGRDVRVRYGTQIETAPPSFILFSTGRLSDSWKRFLERRIREEYSFLGNPIRLVVRERTRERR
ncbi:MAG: ribosome biogenesis GTPase Der [Actinomycetota bacterium]